MERTTQCKNFFLIFKHLSGEGIHITFPFYTIDYMLHAGKTDIRITANYRIIQFFKHLRLHPIIRINKTDIFTSCTCDACVTCWPQSSIFLVNYLYSSVVLSILTRNFSTTVRTTIINKNYFNVFKRLSKNTVNTFT